LIGPLTAGDIFFASAAVGDKLKGVLGRKARKTVAAKPEGMTSIGPVPDRQESA
jgi:hypothetical protein